MKLKTPLRYPGGKSRATDKIFKKLPEFKYYRELFLGGGSCALYISHKCRTPVWVNDKYFNLFCFWKALQEDSVRLYNSILESKIKADEYEDNVGAHRELFITSRDRLVENLDVFERGVLFYIANKCSFSGLGESSGFSAQASQSNFSYAGIQKLKEYGPLIQHWLITNYDYSDLLQDPEPETFIFADPPYDIKSGLYGKKGAHHLSFDHVDFARQISNVKSNVMITYNSSEDLRELYKDWNQSEWDLTYTMHSGKMYRKDEKNRKELLLTNYDIEQRSI